MIKNYLDEPITLNSGPILLDFYATWCGPCRMTSNYLDKYSESHPDQLIVKIDVDQCESIAENYGVQNLPTLIYLKDGEVQWRHVGMMTDKQLEQELC